jgi:CubicO group peptidase (beta-lactamase class C family)
VHPVFRPHRRRNSLNCFAPALLFSSLTCSYAVSAEETVAARISHVQDALLPAVIIDGELPQTSTLANQMRELHVPGVSIAVIRNGKLDWARGFGVTRTGGSAVIPSTLFHACSISKPVSAMAMLTLAQRGKLDLDKDVNAYLTSWKLPSNEFTSKTKVTLRELLNHTGGVSIAGFPGYVSGSPLPTLAQMLDGEQPANTPPIRVDMMPGIGFRYSGGGFLVAQQMVEDVTRRPFAQFVRDAVLRPIGMTSSAYEQPLSRARASRSAVEYDARGVEMAGGALIQPELAPAGLWTTATDLARWAIELQHALSGQSDRVLSRAMAQEMVSPGLQSWGLGISVGGTLPHRYFTHSGVSPGGFRTFLLAYEEGDGIVVLTNGANGEFLRHAIVRTVAQYFGWPDFQPAVRHVSRDHMHDTASLEGFYQLNRYTTMTIARDGSNLYVQRSGQQRFEILPEGHDRYFGKVVDVEFAFEFGEGGKVRGFTSLQNGHSEYAKAIDGSRMQVITESLARRQKDPAADPESEPLLRRYVEQLRSSSINYGELSVPVAQMTRQRQPDFSQLFNRLGDIRTVTFAGVTSGGEDLFDVRFDNGSMRWTMLPDGNGGIDDVGFTFLMKVVG